MSKVLLSLASIYPCHGAAFGQQAQRPDAGDRSGEPYEIIRSMEAIQDQVVLGDAEAQTRLPKLIGQIAERLLTAPPEVWRVARNDRALVIYTLSGGQPRVIRKAIQANAAPEAEANLMAGALAYVEGQEAKARQLLLAIDAKTLAPSLAGYVALAQSALTVKDDPRRALGLLDEARILAPGTLIEEAALRRSVFLADEMVDFSRFVASSSQYLRRYQKSAYADNFRRRFAESMTRFGATSDLGERDKLAGLLNELDAADQLKFYLIIAQSNILKGKIEPARFAAEQAVRLSQETGLEAARSKLYEATTTVLTRSPEAGAGELLQVDASRLSKRDLDLKDIITRLAGEIQKATDEAQGPADVESVEEKATSHGNDGTGESPLVLSESAKIAETARTALTETEALLKRAGP